MTADDISFLRRSARKEHLMVFKTVGPSQGDPDGWQYLHEPSSCSIMRDAGYGAVAMHGPESDCNCGAFQVNRRLDAILNEFEQGFESELDGLIQFLEDQGRMAVVRTINEARATLNAKNSK